MSCRHSLNVSARFDYIKSQTRVFKIVARHAHPLPMLPLVMTLQNVNCDGVRYYSFSKNNCLSVAQCLDNDEFPYSLGRICVGIPPDTTSGMTHDKHGAYMCPSDRYIIFNKTIARCVQSVAECPGFYVLEEKKACLNSSWVCAAYVG